MCLQRITMVQTTLFHLELHSITSHNTTKQTSQKQVLYELNGFISQSIMLTLSCTNMLLYFITGIARTLYSKGIHPTQHNPEFQTAVVSELLNECYPLIELKILKNLISNLIDLNGGYSFNIHSSTIVKHEFTCTHDAILVSLLL